LTRYAHLIGGFFYALNDIYTQGGIYNNNITNGVDCSGIS
jgi:hypothetical protein